MAVRWLQFAQLVAGSVILAAGVIQLTFSRLFRSDRNPPLAAVGFAGLLYGTRLLAAVPEVHQLSPLPAAFWQYLDATITYVILVPLLYYIEATFGAGRHQSITWMRRLASVYAVAAICLDAFTRTPAFAKAPNGYIVVAAVFVTLSNSFRAADSASNDFRIVRLGFVVFGALVLFENIVNDRFLGGRWNVEWVGVLTLMACLGYVAASRATETDRRLHELKHELETARQIQASILPQQMPALSGIAIAARYLPMTAVAGDFFDFLEVGGGRLGVLVADVSGHGVPAALIASMVKVALVAQAAHADDPARVLSGMNHVFCGRLERQFVTAAYAWLEPGAARLRYGAAGHPPALIVRADGTVDEIANNGVMLGHFPDWKYTSIERQFTPGDRLILYTDGVIEASDPQGEFFDAHRLRTLAHEGRSQSADAFADGLVRHVSAWTRRHGFDDDVTIVVIDRV